MALAAQPLSELPATVGVGVQAASVVFVTVVASLLMEQP